MFVRRLLMTAMCVATLACSQSARAFHETDRLLAMSVFEELLGHVQPLEGVQWPPTLILDESLNFEAYSTINEHYDPPRPEIHISQGAMIQCIQRDRSRMAMLLGHELCHILCGHCDSTSNLTYFVYVNDQRLEEHEADLEGLKLAVKAGYEPTACMSLFEMFLNMHVNGGQRDTCFESLSSSHPSARERLAYIDEHRGELWQAHSSFQTGVQLLMFENYLAAERYFIDVLRVYPDCHEALANLGYCRLMQYCDGLTPDDLVALEVPPIVIGSFYHRATSLELEGVRGGAETADLWYAAVDDLRRALELNPESMLAAANLGLAYLVCPEGKDVGEAYRHLTLAAQLANSDQAQPEMARAAVLANVGILDLAAGDEELALERFAQVDHLRDSIKGGLPDSRRLSPALLAAISYHRAQLLLAQNDDGQSAQAVKLLEQCLKKMSRASYFWTMIYEQYAQLCVALDIEPRGAEVLAANANAARPVMTLDLGGGLTLALGMPVEELHTLLGEGELVEQLPGTQVRRVRFADQHLTVLVTTQLVAIYLDDEAGAPLVLRPTGLATDSIEIRVGSSLKDLMELLGEEVNYDHRELTRHKRMYRYFKDLGFAVRVEGDRIVEIVIAQVPYQS